MYDYLIVGSGLFGSTFAHLATSQGKRCFVIDKRSHLGGNVYCENIEGINVHKYGAHIFHGRLDWRMVSFKTRVEDTPNYQGVAVMNYTSHEVPYTRIIEHKHFEMFGHAVYDCPKTIISEEYSTEYREGMEPYYPVNDESNDQLAHRYRELAEKEQNVIFGGRLAEYRYYDMHQIIDKVISMFIY